MRLELNPLPRLQYLLLSIQVYNLYIHILLCCTCDIMNFEMLVFQRACPPSSLRSVGLFEFEKRTIRDRLA